MMLLRYSCRAAAATFRPAILLLMLLFGQRAAQAQMEPAAQYTKLTVAQLMAWTPNGTTAVPANVSQVPLAMRQNTLATQLNPAQSFSHQVNYIPDGMANWAGYLNEQNRFNLYNFTHWQYIDLLTWFDGPVAIPTKPWIEAAHRNGVKIIGSVFTNAADVAALVQTDASGNYIAAQKLVDVANYYGFDGWFFNEEARVPTATATELRNLLKQIQLIKPAGLEIHWYDAMLPSGLVSYQNALNANNQLLLQEGPTRVSDAMFTNYFWSGPTRINTSVTTAQALGRSPFDVYMGADLWPNRSNQSLFAQSAWADHYFTNNDLTQPKLSFGLFAANLTYNGGFNSFNSNPADYANFYQTEARMFAGNDLDPSAADASGWKGFGHYVPVRSVIHSLPFETYFAVGQGKIFANNGVLLPKDWTDMARQSLLPSWQWAKSGSAPVTAGYDFDLAYYAGNSIRLAGSLDGTNSATVRLYQTKLPITAQTSLDLTYKVPAAGPTNTKLVLYFTDDLTTPDLLDLGAAATTDWTTQTFSLAPYAGRELAIIGVQATAPAAVAAYQMNLGKLKVYNGTGAVAPKAGFTASATIIATNQAVTFANTSTNATAYEWTFAGGTPATSTDVHPAVSYTTAGTYAVKLRATSATGRDSLIRQGYITVVEPGVGGGNTSLVFDGLSKYVDAGLINLSGSALSLECWVKPASFKPTSPFISSIIGMEDGGNTALLRLGDAGLAANRLQFALSVNGTGRNIASVTALTANTWYHVAATYDGTIMKLYLNGQLEATRTVAGTATANGIFSFGRNNSNSRIIDGAVDEVRVWKRALSAGEIQANACQVTPNAPDLEGHWSCNEASGPFTLDLTGHGHTGTLINMVPTDWSTDVPTQCAVMATRPGPAVANLQVLVLGNPVPGAQAEIEIHGAQGQPVELQLLNTLGAVVWKQNLQPMAQEIRRTIPMPGTGGLYVLRATTPKRTATVKLLKL